MGDARGYLGGARDRVPACNDVGMDTRPSNENHLLQLLSQSDEMVYNCLDQGQFQGTWQYIRSASDRACSATCPHHVPEPKMVLFWNSNACSADLSELSGHVAVDPSNSLTTTDAKLNVG